MTGDTFGAYVVGYESGEKVGKVIHRLAVKIEDGSFTSMTANRAKALLDDIVKMTGRKLVVIEFRNLRTVYRGSELNLSGSDIGMDTIDEKYVYNAAMHSLVRYHNGRIVT